MHVRAHHGMRAAGFFLGSRRPLPDDQLGPPAQSALGDYTSDFMASGDQVPVSECAHGIVDSLR